LLGNAMNLQALQLFADRALLQQGGFVAALTLLLLALATLKWLVDTLRRRYWPAVRFVVQIAWPWGALLLLLLTPFGATNAIGELNQLEFGYTPIRFGLSLWALGGILLAQLLYWWRERQDSWLPDALAVLFSIHGWVTLMFYQHELMAGALSGAELASWLLILIGAILLERVWRNAAWPRRYKISALASAALISVLVIWPRYQGSLRARAQMYDYKYPVSTLVRQQVDELDAQRVNVVGGFSDWFVLYNPGLTTRYIFCPHQLDSWRQCIHNQGVDTVFFVQQEQAVPGVPREADVLAAYADDFVRVPSDDRVHVYRVVQ
jgi:predicted anti-sigma-YlaC factor YlaD